MKVAVIDKTPAQRVVAVSHDAVTWHDLVAGGPLPDIGTVIALLRDPAQAEAAFARPGWTAVAESLRCPVVAPSKIIGVGRNYAAHRDEMGRDPLAEPLLFTKWPNALSGPTDPIVVDDALTAMCDHEVEIAVIMGERVVDVDVAAAERSIFGYAVANDVTARDVQQRSQTWDRSKGFDSYSPLGPWITTTDEIDDWTSLELRCSVNGTPAQRAKAGEMTFSIPELIAFISRGATLYPGDVILTGTPAGVRAAAGAGATYLADGDVVVCDVDRLGQLVNVVTTRAASTLKEPA
jgi:acylpyruvate hydrolase